MVSLKLQRAAPAGALAGGAGCLIRARECPEERSRGAAPLPCRITGQAGAVKRQAVARTGADPEPRERRQWRAGVERDRERERSLRG